MTKIQEIQIEAHKEKLREINIWKYGIFIAIIRKIATSLQVINKLS